MVCEMAITHAGTVARYEFYAGGVPLARAPHLHRGVGEALGRQGAGARCATLYELFKVLYAARGQRGAIDFETVETRMEFDARGKIERIVAEPRNDAHRLIEECMLAANVCAGDFLAARGQPALYRVHDVPAADKVGALREFLAELGLSCPAATSPGPRTTRSCSSASRRAPISRCCRRSCCARSSRRSTRRRTSATSASPSTPTCISPRRSGATRTCWCTARSRPRSPGGATRAWTGTELGRHCSETERRADDASRDVENWLKCHYMQDHVGGVFEGAVTGVTPFGLFVTLDEYFVDGLVHISELGRDYYEFDATRHMLLGERTKKRYRLADRMKVKLVRVDLESRKIDFVPA